MTEFMEIIKKDLNIQNEDSQTIEKYNKNSFSTSCQVGQNALIRNKVFEQLIEMLGHTNNDMDIEIERKTI